MSAKSLFVNILTFMRVPFIFGWLVLAVLQELSAPGAALTLGVWAVIALALAGLTDFFDGALARRWNVVSSLGKMADPLMDKVFYVVAFPALTWLIMHQGNTAHAIIMLIFTILYILRDLWVTFLRSVATMFGANVAAMMLGKVRTALSFPAAGLIYIYLFIKPTLSATASDAGLIFCYAVEAFMIVLNLISFGTYTCAYWPYVKKALEKG